MHFKGVQKKKEFPSRVFDNPFGSSIYFADEFLPQAILLLRSALVDFKTLGETQVGGYLSAAIIRDGLIPVFQQQLGHGYKVIRQRLLPGKKGTMVGRNQRSEY